MPAKHRMSQAEIEQTISFKDLCEDVDERDPRALANQFPCFGTHSVPQNWMANASAVWKHCGRCGIRCVYAPRLGAPANSMQASPLPADVVLALQRLVDMYQQDNVALGDITGQMVRSMIMKVQRGRLQHFAQTNRQVRTVDCKAASIVKTKSSNTQSAAKSDPENGISPFPVMDEMEHWEVLSDDVLGKTSEHPPTSLHATADVTKTGSRCRAIRRWQVITQALTTAYTDYVPCIMLLAYCSIVRTTQ